MRVPDVQTARTAAPDKEFLKSLLSLFKGQSDLVLVHCLHMFSLVIADKDAYCLHILRSLIADRTHFFNWYQLHRPPQLASVVPVIPQFAFVEGQFLLFFIHFSLSFWNL